MSLQPARSKEFVLVDPPSWGPYHVLSPFSLPHSPTPAPLSGLNLPRGLMLHWSSDLWGQVILLVVLLLVAAFASGSETALTSVERLRVRHMAEENVAGSRSLDKLLRDPNQFLTAILILNMVTIIVASGMAVRLALDVFGDQVPEILVSLGFSVIVLIAAEIIPKSLAIRTAERTALRVAPLLAVLAQVLAPFVIFFREVTNVAMRVLGVRKVPGPFVTDEQLLMLATIGDDPG